MIQKKIRQILDIANVHKSVHGIFCKRTSWSGGEAITTGTIKGSLAGACGSSVTIASIFSVK